MNKRLIIHISQLHTPKKNNIYMSTINKELQINTKLLSIKIAKIPRESRRKRGIHRVKVEVVMFRNTLLPLNFKDFPETQTSL